MTIILEDKFLALKIVCVSYHFISFILFKINEMDRGAIESSPTVSEIFSFLWLEKVMFKCRRYYVSCQRFKNLFYTIKEKGTLKVKPLRYYLSF